MEYRSIPGHSEKYVAGSDGFVYSLVRGEPRALVGAFDGQKHYLHVWAYPIGGKRVSRNVHVLVCSAFHGERPSPRHTASHINGDKLDNRPENLMWELHADNLSRKIGHGTHDRGLQNSRSVMTPERLEEVRKLLKEGKTHQSIADKFGVSRPVITRINTGVRYQAS